MREEYFAEAEPTYQARWIPLDTATPNSLISMLYCRTRSERFESERVRFWDGAFGFQQKCNVYTLRAFNNGRLVMLSAVMAASIMDLFEETGAYLRGHFRLTSGLHSAEYLQCAKVLAFPAYAERLGRDLAERIKSLVAWRLGGCGGRAGVGRHNHWPRGRAGIRRPVLVHGTRWRFKRDDATQGF